MHTKHSLAALSDDALDRGIQTCAARKHTTDAQLLAFIAESGEEPSAGSAHGGVAQLAPAQVKGEQTKLAPEQVEEVDCWARITPLSGDRYSVSLTIDRATHELWRHNQSLLSHLVPSGNLAEVLRRSLAESGRQFEKRRFRASGAGRRVQRHAQSGGRYIPKQVRDAVWQRDGGCCTFVGKDGHRCGSRTRLELDHIVPVARGGASTVDNLRLRCRVHNQFEAERVFGADFMEHKREQAHEAVKARAATEHQAADAPETVVASKASVAPEAAEERKDVATPAPATVVDSLAASAGTMPSPRSWIAEARTRATAAGLIAPREPDIVSALRQLGMRADQARALAKVCDTIPEAPFEERLRVALSLHGSTVAKPMRITDGATLAR